MSTTVTTDFTTRPVLRPDLTDLIAYMQEQYERLQGDADKAGEIDSAAGYQGEAYAYHDILTRLTTRQCEACGVYEGDTTVRADLLATCRATKRGIHVWDFPDEEIHIDLSHDAGVVCGGCGVTLHVVPDPDGKVTCIICGHRTEAS